MNILYGFSNCSYKKYNTLFKDASVMILQQAQKYHSLMTAGLVANGVDVQCISGLPINRQFDKSLYINGGNDEENGVKYHYFGSINLPVFRQFCLILKSFFYTLLSRHKDIAICDILNISIVMGMRAACKIRGIPLIGIVTDVPGKLAHSGKKSFSEKIDAHIMQQMNGYVLLTEAMNDIVNIYEKPYTVIEGQVDTGMADVPNTIEQKTNPRVMMYAGSLKKIYGISRLVEAFITVQNSDWELHIYGDGDYREELERICVQYPNVKYMGIKLNSEIVAAEIKASLLVNPRPTDEEYTKYSFPSKNMEYMVSGTPVLTTKLPGMPEEYRDYVYIFEDESADGMRETLSDVLMKTSEKLHDFGAKAKEFVLDEKNNTAQAEKVVALMNRVRG